MGTKHHGLPGKNIGIHGCIGENAGGWDARPPLPQGWDLEGRMKREGRSSNFAKKKGP